MSPFDLPTDARPGRDQMIGQDELGNPVYRTMRGTQYTVPERVSMPAPAMRDRFGMVGEAVRGATLGGIFDVVKQLGRGIYEGLEQGVTAPRRALQGQPMTMGDAAATAGMGIVGAAGGAAPAGSLRSGISRSGDPEGIRAFHGSPYDFDRFDMSKIGTGVGAPDAYSKGLYFAESQDVAEHFKRLGASPMIEGSKGRRAGLSDDAYELVYKFTSGGERGTLADVAARAQADLSARQNQMPASAVREYRRIIDELSARGSEDVRLGSNMYEVNINAKPETFADWDKPISQQSDKVKSALSEFPPEKTWKEVYESGQMTPSDARAKGLSGTTYRASDGSRNYVVFDENLISIVRKYGIAGAATMLGVTAADVQSALADNMPQSEWESLVVGQ
jgi:hypothetical protein